MSALRARSTPFFASRARQLPALPGPDLARFLPEHVRFASHAWTMRAEEEHRSATTFAALGHALATCGAPLDVVDAALGIARDEVAHAALCTDLARRFGASPPRGSTTVDVPRTALGEVPLRNALRLWLVEGAIGETLSSALFARGRNLAQEPCTRAALGCILRDEVMHARTSWEALREMTRDLPVQDREWLQEQTRLACGAIENSQMAPVLARLKRHEPFDAEWARLGVLPPEERVDVFYDTFEHRIRRELARLQIDFQRAWDHRYR